MLWLKFKKVKTDVGLYILIKENKAKMETLPRSRTVVASLSLQGALECNKKRLPTPTCFAVQSNLDLRARRLENNLQKKKKKWKAHMYFLSLDIPSEF